MFLSPLSSSPSPSPSGSPWDYSDISSDELSSDDLVSPTTFSSETISHSATASLQSTAHFTSSTPPTPPTTPTPAPPIGHRIRWYGYDACSPAAQWTEDTDDLIPRLLPYLAALFNRYWGINTTTPISVTLLGEGSSNKAFLVKVDVENSLLPREFVMRLSLPTLPEAKVLSEVATMRFVKHRTQIPVPQVYMYNASSSNALGYEWILMEHMPGKPFRDVKNSLDDDARRAFAKTLAEWVDSLSRLQFDQIGSLYMPGSKYDGNTQQTDDGGLQQANDGTIMIDNTDSDSFPTPVIGRLTSGSYTGDWRHEYKFSRGPFGNMHDFVLSFAQATEAEVHDPRQRARAQLTQLTRRIASANYRERGYERRVATSRWEAYNQTIIGGAKKHQNKLDAIRDRLDKLQDEEFSEEGSQATTIREYRAQESPLVVLRTTRYDFETLDHHQSSSKKLVEMIKSCVPKETLPHNSTALQHWDVHEDNVLVGEGGQPTALLDWEQLYTVPLALATAYYPKVLAFSDNSFTSSSDGYTDTEMPSRRRIWEGDVMREAFDKRLTELNSPWLVVRDNMEEYALKEKEVCPSPKTLLQRIYSLVESAWILPRDIDLLAEDINWGESESEDSD